jgi:gamma-butyrobetaine dioxygenase
MTSELSTPDFDSYPAAGKLVSAKAIKLGVEVAWEDGTQAVFNRFWLRENDPGPLATHPETREQMVELAALPDDLHAVSASINTAGLLSVDWSTGDTSQFHPDWLAAYRSHGDNIHQLPARVLWNHNTLNEVPRLDGPSVAEDPGQFAEYCRLLHVYGCVVLEGLPCESDTVEKMAAMIGPVRRSNFGYLFDVRADTEKTSNAYTSMPLPLHSDLCTREYMPGLQFLHCMENSVAGGDSLLADGYALAQIIAERKPDYYHTLTTLPCAFYNKATDSDYRAELPVIVLDRAGELEEVRMSPWLRAPLRLPAQQVEDFYQAMRYLLQLSAKEDQHLQFRLQPGDLLAFDNRRVFHGRTGFEDDAGERWLRGCYGEREELHSRLRLQARAQRAIHSTD